MYQLTRGILQALVRKPYRGVVGILTKSPLVLRDADLLAAVFSRDSSLTAVKSCASKKKRCGLLTRAPPSA